MKCPKCGHEQTSKNECQACGIIFEKFIKFQEKQKTVESKPEIQEPPKSTPNRFIRPLNIFIGLAAILMISAGLFFFQTTEKTDNAETVKQPDPPNQPKIAENERTGIEKQLYDYHTPQTKIETAQLAVVFIKTPWGLGSGFFINEECDIITNKHVLTVDQKTIKMIRVRMDNLVRMIAMKEEDIKRYQKSLFNIKKYNYPNYNVYKRILKQHEDGIEKKRHEITEMEIEYEKLREHLDLAEQSPEWNEYEVHLFDESKHIASKVTLSDTYDVALLSIDQENCPCLKPGETENLRTGQRVYTIGNPLGLSHTVTSGIISGQRMHEEINYIQTDASINPGNSGGPLIDESGRVIGINTMIIKNTEGIGFAFPIHAALQEFEL